jgi:uncharacterized membrane protein
MTTELPLFALWFNAIGCGLMAGVYFAFSTFIMTAFARIPDHHGISAMQAINRVIQRSLFMPLFFATTLVSVALMVFAVLVVWGSAAATVLLAAGATYVLGMFVCTIVFNVPLNNALDAADPASNEAAVIWRRYLARWTAWNHVRTLASTVASALYIAAAWAR